MISELLYFNGINGESGDYDLPPMTVRELTSFIQGETKPKNLDELKAKYAAKNQVALGIGEGVNANHLDEAGWGVIFATDTDPRIIEALQPLLNLRKEQTGKDYFHVFQGPDGYRREMSKTDFLSKYGVGPGAVDPLKIPYYLLLVGDPEKIPYSFQTQLDVPYSVGRISFKTPQEYANYAASVVAVETKPVKLPRRAAFFGVQNPDDPATALSKADLVQPLLESMTAQKPDWQFNAYLAAQAQRRQLDTLLGGDPAQTPALLFSASHGMGFPNGDKRQLTHQGALLCQNWPGPEKWGKRAIPEEFYFAGDHLPADRNLLGMIAFLFACYSAGTPEIDQFSKQFFRDRVAIAPRPFLANLPMKMLGLPRGGALAVVGHVERAWGYSFKWTQAGQQAETFQSALLALLSGKTVGMAVEYFNERYAEIATVLGDKLEDIEFGKKYDPYDLAKMWTANNDARGYTILGDPAVRLPVVTGNEAPRLRPERIVLETVQIPSNVAPIPEKTASVTKGISFDINSNDTEGKIPTEGGLFMNTSTRSLQDVTQSMMEFSQKLLQIMQQSLDDMSSVTVRSCLVENPDEGPLQTGTTPFAVTRVNLDGDTQVFVSNQGGGPSPELMKLHNDTVQITLAWRTETFKAMSDTLGSWLRPAAGSEK